MTPSGFLKSKLAFSIESLVGGQISPTLSDCQEGTETSNAKTEVSGCPAVFEPFFSKAFLNLPENPSVVRRPQPVNVASHFSQGDLELQVPAYQQRAKEFGTIPNIFMDSPMAFPSFPQFHGIPLALSSHLNPLLGGLSGVGSSISREYSPYPWMPSRHGRIFPHGLFSPEQLAYFLHPFRKSKRIRTAFSPSQLLKLEQSFEKNQYVVGVERKQLAQNLNLSETQVKVWFQNRRTKEKKNQQDDDEVIDEELSNVNDKMEEVDGEDETVESLKTEIVDGNQFKGTSKRILEVTKINKFASDNKISDCNLSTSSIHPSSSYSLPSSNQNNSSNINALTVIDS